MILHWFCTRYPGTRYSTPIPVGTTSYLVLVPGRRYRYLGNWYQGIIIFVIMCGAKLSALSMSTRRIRWLICSPNHSPWWLFCVIANRCSAGDHHVYVAQVVCSNKGVWEYSKFLRVNSRTIPVWKYLMGFRDCFRLLLDSICNLLQMPMPFPSKLLGPPWQCLVAISVSIWEVVWAMLQVSFLYIRMFPVFSYCCFVSDPTDGLWVTFCGNDDTISYN